MATAILAGLAYEAEVEVATDYGRLLCVAFDLHRFDMLRALHILLPMLVVLLLSLIINNSSSR